MVSLREKAQCVGVSGDFSVLKDFFGYRMGQPRTSSRGKGQLVSVLDQVKALQGKHIHLDLIRVGGDEFLPGHKRSIDFAVYDARKTFAQVGLGIGRASHLLIPVADADGMQQIDSISDAKKLRRKFRGPHDDALDVFIIMDFDVVVDGEEKAGLAKINVSCNKNVYHNDGVVMGLHFGGGTNVDAIMLGQLLAHEVGHCLGLYHTDTVGNLMFPIGTGTSLSADQGQTMREHCFVRPGC